MKKKYFIASIEDDDFFVVTKDFFHQFDEQELPDSVALDVYYSCLVKLQEYLVNEQKNGSEYIGNMKVSTGLVRSIEELEKKFPFIRHQLTGVSRRFLNFC